MHILQMAMLPVEVKLGDTTLKVPKMGLRETTAWAAKVSEEWTARATQGMQDFQVREYLTMYPPSPPHFRTLRALIGTSAGVEHVLREQLTKADVYSKEGKKLPTLTEDAVDRILSTNSTRSLEGLAREIADLEEQSPKPAPQGGELEADPLKSTAKPGSKS